MSKQQYKKIPIDKKTYNLLEQRAKKEGVSVDEYVTECIVELVETMKREDAKNE